jgi:hypothetical protein
MPTARLSALDSEFYHRLIRESDETLREMGLAACRYAVEKTRMNYPAILAALKSMMDKKPLSEKEISEMGKLVAALDIAHITTDIRDRDATGKTDTLAGQAAMFQARAANAVFLASNSDPLFAAMEAIYEAYRATGDWPALKAMLTAKED